MQKIIIYSFIAVLMSSSLSYADVWVVHKDGEVYSISQQPDAVVPQGYTVEVLKGTIEDLALTRPIDEYIFVDRKFKVDVAKVKAKEDKQIVDNQMIIEEKIKEDSAKSKLRKLGLTDDEIEALLK